MQRLRLDLRQLDNLDIRGQGSSLSGSPSRRTLSSFERTLVKSAVGLSSNILLQEAVSVFDNKPPLVILPPTSVPVGSGASPPTHFTMGVGLSLSAAAVIGVTGGGGLYASTTPELGVYVSAGGGWWTNVLASAGVQLTFILGPPSDFAGISWGIGADVRFMTGSVGGLLLFSPPPFRFLGFSVSLTAGPSAIPAFDVTVQVSNTWTKPILK